MLHGGVHVHVHVYLCVTRNREPYLQRCSLKYREFDFFPPSRNSKKYSGHPRRKPTLPSLRKISQRRLLSFPFKFLKITWGTDPQTFAGIGNSWEGLFVVAGPLLECLSQWVCGGDLRILYFSQVPTRCGGYWSGGHALKTANMGEQTNTN